MLPSSFLKSEALSTLCNDAGLHVYLLHQWESSFSVETRSFLSRFMTPNDGSTVVPGLEKQSSLEDSYTN